MPSRRVWMILAGVAVLAVVVLVCVLLTPRGDDRDDSESPSSSEEQVEVPDAAPPAPLDVAPHAPGYAGLINQQWAADISDSTDISYPVVLAYAGAVMAAQANFPECTLSWNTLAGIGSVESDHGRHDGASVDAAGNVSPPIFGVPLTGGDVENIPDTDGGEIDGTAEFDRAVGPMQIIPSTWTSWTNDGNGDGIQDPQNIFDSTLAAANYLCFHNPDWSTPDDWRAGISWYNAATGYAANVAAAAQRYADAAAAIS